MVRGCVLQQKRLVGSDGLALQFEPVVGIGGFQSPHGSVRLIRVHRQVASSSFQSVRVGTKRRVSQI